MSKYKVVIEGSDGNEITRVGIPSSDEASLRSLYQDSGYMVTNIIEMTEEEIIAFEGVDDGTVEVDMDEYQSQPPQPTPQPIQHSVPPQPQGGVQQANAPAMSEDDIGKYASKLLKQNYQQGGQVLRAEDILPTIGANATPTPTPTPTPETPNFNAVGVAPTEVVKPLKPRYFKRGGIKFKQVGDDMFIQEYVLVDKGGYKIEYDIDIEALADDIKDIVKDVIDGSKLSVLDWVKVDEDDEVEECGDDRSKKIEIL
jgi:hypothetical protein